MRNPRDHGGGLDAAIERFGGKRSSWIDLSTGINPRPYPLPGLSQGSWTQLPDINAMRRLEETAARFWQVPSGLAVVSAPGASALIATLPSVFRGNSAYIPDPTYNEHRAAFHANGWIVREGKASDVTVIVNPNNPTGRLWKLAEVQSEQVIVDESFCDVTPESSLLHQIAQSDMPGPWVILKSFGKFWGLAGLRLGFAICKAEVANRLRDQLGPWAVSGPACEIGAAALSDPDWSDRTRTELKTSSERLDQLLSYAGFSVVGGTSLFRLAQVEQAQHWYERLATANILTRKFPYSDHWLRFGLPATEQAWERLERALEVKV